MRNRARRATLTVYQQFLQQRDQDTSTHSIVLRDGCAHSRLAQPTLTSIHHTGTTWSPSKPQNLNVSSLRNQMTPSPEPELPAYVPFSKPWPDGGGAIYMQALDNKPADREGSNDA